MDERRRRWIGLVFLSGAVSVVIIDVTVINIAVPSIVGDLNTTAATTQWIQEAYTLTLAALLIVVGRIADTVGRRRVLVSGLLIFTAASVLAALAPSGGLLVFARVLQGVGGAAILPSTLSLINATFRDREREVAFAIWGATIGAMAAVGPLLGGWLTTELSWRWAFWINLVLAPVAAVGAYLFVTESRAPHRARGIDLVGTLLSVGTFFLLAFALIEGRTMGWWAARTSSYELIGGLSPVPFAAAGAGVGLAVLVGSQRRRERSNRATLLDLALFRVPTFVRGNSIAVLVALGQLGLLFVLPLWLQNVLGFSATGTGVLLLPIAIGAFLAAGTTPMLAQRWGAAWVIRIGLLTEIVGLCWLAAIATSDISGWALVPALALYGFGVGTADAQLPSLILRDIPVEQSGQGSGVQSTAQELGSAMGVAIIGTVLFTTLSWQLSDALRDTTLTPAQQRATVSVVVESAGTAIPGLDAETQAPAKDALSTATRYASLTGAGFLLAGLVATASLKRRHRGVVPGDPAPAATEDSSSRVR